MKKYVIRGVSKLKSEQSVQTQHETNFDENNEDDDYLIG